MRAILRRQAFLALGLGAAVLLSACGGGGGGSAPSATQMAHFYTGSSGSRDFWVLAASQVGTGREFYAISHPGAALSSTAAVIYSGTAKLGSQGEATVSPLNAQLENGRLRSGSATLSNVSTTGLGGTFVLSDISDAESRLSYSASRVGTVDALAGAWSGRWLDGSNSNAAFSFTAPSAGARTLITPLAACPGIELVFGAFDAASGLYRVQLKYPNEEQCTALRDNKTLSGLAAVHGSGVQQELRFVAVDESGSGISFVGRRAPPP